MLKVVTDYHTTCHKRHACKNYAAFALVEQQLCIVGIPCLEAWSVNSQKSIFSLNKMVLHPPCGMCMHGNSRKMANYLIAVIQWWHSISAKTLSEFFDFRCLLSMLQRLWLNGCSRSKISADRQTNRQSKYCNPRCACTPRVKSVHRVVAVGDQLVM